MANGLFLAWPIGDARSLRLNFESNVEYYSPELGRQLTQMAHLSKSRSLSLEEVDARALPIKLRDGIARMFAPYL
jgi:cardiolipin synthase